MPTCVEPLATCGVHPAPSFVLDQPQSTSSIFDVSFAALSPLPSTAGSRRCHPDTRRRHHIRLDAELCGAGGDLLRSSLRVHFANAAVLLCTYITCSTLLNQSISDGHAWETFLASVTAGS